MIQITTGYSGIIPHRRNLFCHILKLYHHTTLSIIYNDIRTLNPFHSVPKVKFGIVVNGISPVVLPFSHKWVLIEHINHINITIFISCGIAFTRDLIKSRDTLARDWFNHPSAASRSLLVYQLVYNIWITTTDLRFADIVNDFSGNR